MANPPITVGELTDVPAPESPINAQFHQEVANRITHRFATLGQMNAWAAGNGSLAFCAEVNAHYARLGGAWVELALIPDVTTVNSNLQAQINALPTGLINRVLSTTASQTIGASQTPLTGLSITFTPDPARWYRTSAFVPYIESQAAQLITIGIDDNSGTALWFQNVNFSAAAAGERSFAYLEIIESGLSANPKTRRVLGQCNTGSFSVQRSPLGTGSSYPWIAIEDLGAV